MSNGLLVAIGGWEAGPWMERFRRLLPGRPIVALGDDYDPAAIAYAACWRHPHGSLAGLTGLKAIFSLGAGVDHLLNDPGLPDVPILRVVDGDLTQRMSEYVVLHCLMHLRRQHHYDRMQAKRLWDDSTAEPSAREVRVGLMGLGVLGQDAARLLKAIGFQVAGWSRTAKDVPGVATFAGEEGLQAFLACTDILVILLPLTPDTRGIVDRRLLEGLAKEGPLGGPVLINAGRGGLQVEADILAALEEGILQAATLDVFATEPLPPESPFWTHPRVTVTPHNAAFSHPDAVGRLVARQIERFEAGFPFEHAVDRGRGY